LQHHINSYLRKHKKTGEKEKRREKTRKETRKNENEKHSISLISREISLIMSILRNF
jgi:hypothetical protein